MEFIAAFCLLLSIGSGITAWVFIKRSLQISDDNILLQEYNRDLEQHIEFMKSNVFEAYRQMNELDTLGAFASDDEAGTSFKLIKQVIDDLEELTNAEKTNNKSLLD